MSSSVSSSGGKTSKPSKEKTKKADNSSDENTKKPKRPLSGYNLFYRYKRNKVLEATAASASSGATNTSSEDGKDNEGDDDDAKIRQIITSLPGLENVSPTHPVWSLPTTAINEIRASNIRRDMEGKLFPNENARNRLHRKVHGMGFVEMGKLMRDMWARVDDFTKDVFGELADVGRVRYRRLLAEYKLVAENGTLKQEQEPQGAGAGGTQVMTVATAQSATAGSIDALKSQATKKRISFSQEMMFAPEFSQGFGQPPQSKRNSFSQDMMLSGVIPEVTPKVAEKPKFQLLGMGQPFISPTFRQVNMPMAQMQTSSSVVGICQMTQIQPSSTPGSMQGGMAQPNSSMPGTGGSLGLFEPLPVSTNFEGSSSKKAKYNRRVSNDSLCGEFNLCSSASTPVNFNDSSARCTPVASTMMDSFNPNSSMNPSSSSSHLSSLIEAHNQVKNEYEAMLLNNKNKLNSFLPPPPLFQQNGGMANNGTGMASNGGTTLLPNGMNSTRRNSTLVDEIISSVDTSMSNCIDNVIEDTPGSADADASAEDYMELLGSISDENEEKQEGPGSSSNPSRRPSVIFGKPMHDVNIMGAIPILPFATGDAMTRMELNNSTARMA